MNDCTNAVYAENENSTSMTNRIGYVVMKTGKDNNMTEHIGLAYTKTKTELLGIIWPGVVYDENQKGQWRDWSYRCALHR